MLVAGRVPTSLMDFDGILGSLHKTNLAPKFIRKLIFPTSSGSCVLDMFANRLKPIVTLTTFRAAPSKEPKKLSMAGRLVTARDYFTPEAFYAMLLECSRFRFFSSFTSVRRRSISFWLAAKSSCCWSMICCFLAIWSEEDLEQPASIDTGQSPNHICIDGTSSVSVMGLLRHQVQLRRTRIALFLLFMSNVYHCCNEVDIPLATQSLNFWDPGESCHFGLGMDAKKLLTTSALTVLTRLRRHLPKVLNVVKVEIVSGFFLHKIRI